MFILGNSQTAVVSTTKTRRSASNTLTTRAIKWLRIHGATRISPLSTGTNSMTSSGALNVGIYVCYQVQLVDNRPEALQRITGVVPAFARPPYGEYNDLVLEVARVRGQTLVNWDFDSGDSAGKTAAQSQKLYDDIAKKRPSTILALNHDVYQTTAQVVLPYAINTLQKAGYKLVTLAECLGKPAYQSVSTPPPRDEAWLQQC
ncbi:hypothetical protein H0H81_002806 [Sphagnurus paluster]|uniref:Chitin deacetylase n=1 Tax=Sphagnurus paluster TaxID=117069 RepID=A0A9P7KMW4_9AGAR|nr:hypothetical protein H0H81_002806 [Sphagnurus paluster]